MKPYKILFLVILCAGLLSGCFGPVEKIGVTADDPRIEFETFDKGFAYLDRHNFISQKSGYDEEVIINDQEDLEELADSLNVEFDEDVDFDEYMLYVTFAAGSMGSKFKIRSYDISEIAYNDDIIVVKINYDNSEMIEAKDGEWLCYYNISKIKKSDFPYESRDYLSFPDKGNKEKK